MTTPGPARLQSMDLLKAFAIFMVLWGHCIQYLISGEYVDKPVYRLIYSFHMPLFMAISGYFFAMTFRDGFKRMCVRKAQQLIVPTVAWTMIFFCLNNLLWGSSSGIPSMLSNGLWFFKSLLIVCILAYYTNRGGYLQRLTAGAVAIVVANLLPYYQIAWMLPSFIAGEVVYYRRESIRRHSLVLMAVSAAVFLCLIGSLTAQVYADSCTYIISRVYLIADPVGSLLYKSYRLALGLSGALFLYSLFIRVFDRNRDNAVINRIARWGSYTLGIYVIQSWVLETLMARMLNFDSFGFITFNFVIAPVLSLAVMVLCVMLVRFIGRSEWLAAILLGAKMPRTGFKLFSLLNIRN